MGFGLLLAQPWWATVIAALFVWRWWYRRRRLLLVTAAAWATYGAYETLMRARVLCSGECNIRVDLLLLYPALAILSIVALVRARR